MHCIKIINLERDVTTTRFYLLTSIVFFVVFCLAYISTSFNYPRFHNDQHLLLFFIGLLLLYPMHKLLHIVFFILLRTPMHFKLVRRYFFMPIIHVELQELISKRLYSWALLFPFIFLNSILLIGAFIVPVYAHYLCIFLAFHCSICLVDILFIGQIMRAPKNSYIEETAKGYQILVPVTTS